MAVPSGSPLQPNEPTKNPLINIQHETPAEQLEQDDDDDRMSVDISRSGTPFQAQDQDDREVDAHLNGTTPSNVVCVICLKVFTRIQERNRHVESYLPHSILCPFPDCTWTGRRQWDFKEHWRRKHSDAGQVPGEEANEIYDPKEFVRLIVDGTPVEEVARTAFAKVQESLGRLGKPGVGANVLGRNRDLRKWIHIPSSRLT